MPIYSWSGNNKNGTKIQGIDYAKNSSQLKDKLIKHNICPHKITPKPLVNFLKKRAIKTQEITAFIEQFSILLNANITIINSFEIMLHQEKNKKLKNLIFECKNLILAGNSLHETLASYPQYFNEVSCNLIKIGEQSGTLDIILKELVNYLTKLNIQKNKTIKALIYPLIVLSISAITIVILLLFVIPQFKSMYNNFGAKLPSYTQFILSLGGFIQNYWEFILFMIISMLFTLKYTYTKSVKFHKLMDNLCLQLPIIKKILIYSIIIRFTKTSALAFKAGIPLLQTINLSAGTIQNWQYKKAIQEITKSITQGDSFCQALNKQQLFPQLMTQLIAIGEKTGSLDNILEKISMIYSNKLNRLIDNLNVLLEPVIILILGIIIGGLIIGIYLPIFHLGTII